MEIPPSLLNFERVLHTLVATQEVLHIPLSVREERRGTRQNQEEPSFRLLARDECSFHCFIEKGFPHSHSISRRGVLTRKVEMNSRVVPPFQESPRGLSPFQRKLFSLNCLDFHVEDRLTPRWHVGQPCGKASWESHRSLDPRDGKPDTAATAREERAHACPTRAED